jgi:hypothetical protein
MGMNRRRMLEVVDRVEMREARNCCWWWLIKRNFGEMVIDEGLEDLRGEGVNIE